MTEPEKMVSVKLKSHHRKLTREIKLLEECNALGYVDLKTFNVTPSKLQTEKHEVENHLTMTAHEFRNSSLFLGKAIRECLSLSSLWNSLTCYGKRKLADIVFSDGLLYHRDTDRLELMNSSATHESNHESQNQFRFDVSSNSGVNHLKIYRTIERDRS